MASVRTVANGVVAGIVLAAGGLGAAEEDAESTTPKVEDILANPLEDAAYVQDVRCLSPGRYRHIEIASDQVLIFHGRRDEAWVNILPRRCIGLRPDMVLVLDRRGLRTCRRDYFRAMPRMGSDFGTSLCALGYFKPVARSNLEGILEALAASRDSASISNTVRDAETPRE